MGVSTDGILFYGIAYGEDEEFNDTDEIEERDDDRFAEWETILAEKLGVPLWGEKDTRAERLLYIRAKERALDSSEVQ